MFESLNLKFKNSRTSLTEYFAHENKSNCNNDLFGSSIFHMCITECDVVSNTKLVIPTLSTSSHHSVCGSLSKFIRIYETNSFIILLIDSQSFGPGGLSIFARINRCKWAEGFMYLFLTLLSIRVPSRHFLLA